METKKFYRILSVSYSFRFMYNFLDTNIKGIQRKREREKDMKSLFYESGLFCPNKRREVFFQILSSGRLPPANIFPKTHANFGQIKYLKNIFHILTY